MVEAYEDGGKGLRIRSRVMKVTFRRNVLDGD